MAKFLGTWIITDTLSSLIYTVKNTDGTARDLTGHTVRLQGRRYNDVLLAIDIAGVVDPDQTTNRGKVTFSAIPAGLSLGDARRQTFESRIEVTQTSGGLIGYTKPFDIVVEVWP